MNTKQIVFTEKNKAQLLTTPLPDVPRAHEVLVRTAFSTVSAGTERANLTGDPNVSGNGKEAPFARVGDFA